MIAKVFHFSVRAKVLFIFVIVFGLALVWIVRSSIERSEAENQQLIRELLQVNAHTAISVIDTVQANNMLLLGLIAERTRNILLHGGDLDYELSSIFESMNVEYNGILLIENIKVFDADFRVISVANPNTDQIDLRDFISFDYDRNMVLVSPMFVNPHTGNTQVVFIRPVIHDNEVIATVVLRGNTEALHFFVTDFIYEYDNFINIADSQGNIFFTTRPESYLGINLDELGLYEAFGEIPLNTILHHRSAVTGVYKVAYIFEFGELWTIVSFFDADSIESNFLEIALIIFPPLFGFGLAGIASFLLISRSLVPLKQIAVSANEVAKGNVSVMFKVDQNDEFGLVSRSFLGIITALNVLCSNFKNAENALKREDSSYSLTKTKLGGIYDEMIDSANNIIGHIQVSMIEAQQASKAKSDFLATMSHEIRTPLNAILGITQIELQKMSDENDTTRALQQIFMSGRTLLGIINDILDMSKIETGNLELIATNYNVGNLISEAIQSNILRIGSKEIEFIIEADENLPLKLVGDELRIKQILNNVLSNAVKYTKKGHIRFAISSESSDSYANLKFVIEDTGQGLRPSDLVYLFDPYARFNLEENRSVEGAGLGLTITQRLVHMMDGEVNVESEFGKGSVFTINLKQQIVSNEVIGKELADKINSFAHINIGEKKLVNYEPMPYGSILVVDDVETNLHVAEGLLAPYYVRVETVTSGFEVLDKVEHGANYDIILMDHMMPKMDGIETTNRLRQMGYKGTIIALTANALIGSDEMFRSKGFDWYISKPVDVRQLDAALLRFIRDKHPDKHKDQGHMLYRSIKPQNIRPKLRNAIYRDATKAVKAINESLESGDISTFITSVHAMKSAMANIKEVELADMAGKLEIAGHTEDYDFIYEKTPEFVKLLEELIEKL